MGVRDADVAKRWVSGCVIDVVHHEGAEDGPGKRGGDSVIRTLGLARQAEQAVPAPLGMAAPLYHDIPCRTGLGAVPASPAPSRIDREEAAVEQAGERSAGE